MWAGKFYLLHRQLKSLPSDIWQFYMDKAGRSGASHSYMSYVAAYTGLFATRVRYVTDVGRSMLSVSFKGACWAGESLTCLLLVTLGATCQRGRQTEMLIALLDALKEGGGLSFCS